MWVGGEHRSQLQAGLAAANHFMGLFVIEEQIAVERVDQRSTTEGAGDLRDDVERQFVPLETGE
ncbi:hypothetical protein D3C76_1823970 [compost metagenome]